MLRIMHSLIVGRSLSPNRRDPSKALAFPILRRRVSEVLECVSVLLDTVGGSRPSRPRSPPYVNLQSDRLGGISVDPGAGMHPCRVNDCTCTTQFRGTHCSERVDGREEGCEGSLPWRPEQGRVDEQWCPGKYLAFAHKPYPRPYPLPSTHPVLNFEILNSSRKKRNTSQTIAYTQPCKSLFQSSRPPSLLHPKPPPPPPRWPFPAPWPSRGSLASEPSFGSSSLLPSERPTFWGDCSYCCCDSVDYHYCPCYPSYPMYVSLSHHQ